MASTIRPWHSLKTRITLFTLVIFVLSLWSLSYYASQMLRQDMKRLLSEQQLATVSLMASEVNEQLDVRWRVLDIVAGSISPTILRRPKTLQSFLEGLLILHGPFNGGVLVLAADGKAIADSTRAAGRTGVNYMDDSAVGTALREGKRMIGQPVVGPVLKTPVITMAVPIHNAKGTVIGALAGVTNLGIPNYLDKITQNHYGKTGGYLLVAAQSRLIFAATDRSRAMETLPAAGNNPLLDAFLDGYEGSAVLIDPRGVEVLASAKGIAAAGWVMAATLPTDEAFAPILSMQQRMLIATLLLTVLAAVLTWRMLWTQLSPLLAAARRLAIQSATDQPLQPLPIARQDEISQLIDGFNGLLQTLGQREEALKDSEKLLNATQRISKTGGWAWDVEQQTMTWTEETYRIHDLEPGVLAQGSPEHFSQEHFARSLAFYEPGDRAVVLAAFQRCAESGEDYDMEFPFTTAKGRRLWIRTTGQAVCADGRVVRVVGNISDITEQKMTIEALLEQEAFFHLIAESIGDVISVVDVDGRRLYNSPSYLRFFGAKTDLRGTDSFAEIHPEDLDRVKRVFRETVQTGVGRRLDYRFLRADGSVREMESRGSVIRDSAGQVARVVIVSNDITERKLLEEQVRQLAYHDALTQLPNRRLLGDRLSQTMAASARSGIHGALMFLDLDNFKPLNDTHGHEVGDLLLIEAADRMRNCVREMDTVARFGGDEFVVMVSELDVDHAESLAQAGIVAEKIRHALSEPYRLTVRHAGSAEQTVVHRCTVSIGVALFIDHQASQEEVIKCADATMYQAKDAGRNRILFHGQITAQA